MSTNIESWTGTITDIGPMYPFAGSEMIMWFLGIAFWIIWSIKQDREETRQYQKDIEYYTNEHPPG